MVNRCWRVAYSYQLIAYAYTCATTCMAWKLLDNAGKDEFLYLPLGHKGVGDVEATVLPLNGAIDVQSIAQPVVG